MSPIVQAVAAWLLAYAVHSTLLLGAAALLAGRVVLHHAWRETLWKAALVGAVLTVTVQTLADFRPVVGRFSLAAAVAPADPTEKQPREWKRSAAGQPRGEAAPARAAAEPRTTQAETSAPRSDARPAPSAWESPAPRAAPPVREGTGGGWTLRLLLVWAAIAAVLLARVAWRQAALHRLLRDRRPVDDPALLALMDELRLQAGVRAGVRLTRSERCATPMALGTGEVCVPGRFVAELAPEEQRGALAHELAHLARRDPLWHLAAGLAEALFFFQPLNRLARRRLRESAEYLADDWAVRQTGSPLGLARCLVEVAAWVSAAPTPVPEGALAMAEGNPSSLARRVERLVERADLPALPRAGLRAAAALVLLAAVAFVAPAISPLSAEEPETPQPAQEANVVRHRDPSQPLARRWEWAEREARGSQKASYWIAWSVPAAGTRGTATVHDTEGFDLEELNRTPLSRVLGAGEGDAIVLFRVGGDGRVDRISTRVGKVGLELGRAPVYWLGAAPAGESLDWLEARERATTLPQHRAALIAAMGMHAVPDRVVPLLAGRLARDPATDVRAEAAEALGRHPRRDALEALVTATEKDSASAVRHDAVEAIGGMELPGAREVLRRMIARSEDKDVRFEAVESLSDRGGDPAEVLRELESIAYRDRDPDVQRKAVESMENLPALAALPVLSRISWRHRDADVQREAVETLGNLGDGAGLAALDSVVDRHPSAEVQRAAVEALGNLPRGAGLPSLRSIAARHPREEVRAEAREVLRNP